MAHRFEIYKDRAGEYRVRFRYNSEVIWSSEGYTNKSSALNLIDSIKQKGPEAPTEDNTNSDDNLRRRIERAQIPASDRIVRLDHNSPEAKEFRKALEKLTEAVRTSNDFGELTEEDIDVMRSETSEIGPIVERKWIRPAHIWQVAKSTLLWIADRAGGTIVGTIAISLLAALAAMLGIPI